MNRRRGALRRAAIAAGAAALAAPVSAQAALELSLRADPALQGPPALVWVRQHLGRLLPAAGDPRAALHLRWSPALGFTVLAGSSADAGAYLAGRIVADDGSALDLRCDDGGFETWHGSARTAALCPAVTEFLAAADAARAAGATASLDTASLVGLAAIGADTETPLGLLLAVGAAECGELHVRAALAGAELRVEGRSRGGLTLPALLLALARLRGAPPADEERRWIALAFAARDLHREEAALQLARFASRDGERCLRALLHADPATRVRAIEALARRGSADALPGMMAASRGDAGATAATAAALVTLWPHTSLALRDRLRERAREDPLLRAALARAEGSAHAAAIGSGGPADRRSGGPASGTGLAGLLAGVGVLLLCRVLGGFRRS